MLKEFENNRLLKLMPFPFDKMGFKSASDLPTWKLLRLLREIKKTLSLPGCSCMWSESLSGFFLLSSQGT